MSEKARSIMPKVILLDIDDTLLSFQAYVREGMKSGFEAFGIGPYEEEMLSVFHQVNARLWHELEEGTLSFEELKKIRWNLVFEALGIQADGVKFEEYFRDRLFDSAIPEDGAMELLAYLKGKYVLCAASNGPYLQQKNRLKTGGMLSYFSHLFISEEIGYDKPKKEYFDFVYSNISEKDKSKTLIIGDSLNSDITGAIGYGVDCCWVNRGEDKSDSATYTVKKVEELLLII